MVVLFGLLGQGERCTIDERYDSPISSLITYWDALRANDAEAVWECFEDPQAATPFPGMLWFLPPSDKLGLFSMRIVPTGKTSVTATYEVRFRPHGSTEELRFIASNELVRRHGEWRLLRSNGEVAMPEWRPLARAVDI